MRFGYRKETHKRIVSFTLDEDVVLYIQSEALRNDMKVSLFVNEHFKEIKHGKDKE